MGRKAVAGVGFGALGVVPACSADTAPASFVSVVDWEDVLSFRTALIGVLLFASLQIFYAVMRSEWPKAYSGGVASVERFVSRSPLRYSLYRFGPVVALSAFAAVTASRSQASVGGVLAIGVGLHLALTSGRALVTIGRWIDRPQLVVLHLFVSVGVITCTVAVWRHYPLFDPYVPSADDVVTSLWTAGIGAVLAAYLLRREPKGSSDRAEFSRSRKQVGERLLARIDLDSLEYDADASLMKAIVLSENLARPSWVRRLERNLGRFESFKRATYGVAQISSDHPISDEESIDELVRRWAGRHVDWEYGNGFGPSMPDWHSMERLLKELHNGDNQQVDQIASFYYLFLIEAGFVSPDDVVID